MVVSPCHRSRRRRSSPSAAAISPFFTYSLTQLVVANFAVGTILSCKIAYLLLI
uniref:Transmembrane protein n=1 Tax=Medicago truncatula TaxID=3880 RepID=Q2HVR2_MEDTR|nr:hypothetical protein MtrDRAFT_AC148815g2v2 [Medicago truncatula]